MLPNRGSRGDRGADPRYWLRVGAADDDPRHPPPRPFRGEVPCDGRSARDSGGARLPRAGLGRDDARMPENPELFEARRPDLDRRTGPSIACRLPAVPRGRALPARGATFAPRLGREHQLDHEPAPRQFFIFQQQDDQVSPTYIADLVAAAARCPKAAICYSKMEVSGIESGMVRHKPLLGHPAKRVLTYLERMDTSMFLGLIRSAAIAATSGLPTNAFDSFGAELPFMAELARVGEFRFVEGPTYFKRLHGRNTHLQWYAWPEDRKRAAWLRLAVAMVDAVVPAGKSLTERRHLFYTVLDRFLTARGHRRWSFCKLDDRDTNTRRAMVRTMIELLRESRLDLPACLETRSDSIERLIARRFEMFTRLEPHASSLPA